MNKIDLDNKYMALAIQQAKLAFSLGEVPVGAVIVFNDEVIAAAFNDRETNINPSGHAEINVINKAAKILNNWRLNECTLYVTLEPCPMCTSLIAETRLKRVVFGAYDPKLGAINRPYNIFNEYYQNLNIEVRGGVKEKECQDLLNHFFEKKR